MKGMFDSYSKFLVQKLFKSILRYKLTVKGKRKQKNDLKLVNENDELANDESDESQYMG